MKEGRQIGGEQLRSEGGREGGIIKGGQGEGCR